ncbi:protein kinase domain-containing protein [Amnibacterium endophyticum]|uniref:Protein kinase n=1 Tax=Amnibacterium endophyticum TaxID=2109337 RepID=A0ABW4LIB9_9MICO
MSQDATRPISTDQRLPAALADRYVIGSVLGRGGASTVYAARDLLLGREVAIKVFTERAVSADELRVQQAEAQLVARLSHHALVTLLDAGVDASEPASPRIYLVMERTPGVDLRERLRSGPLPAKQVAYLGFDLADGLHHVHEHGYLHRDVKPANVLLDLRNEEVRVRGKLTDFGISSIIGTEQGEFTTGTAAYLGPEQVEGEDAVPATDVYSLGLVLLEAVTGRVEYPGTVFESAAARLDRDPVVPDSVPAGVATVLRGMLRRRPEERLTLPEVSVGLQNALIDELVRERALDPALLGADEGARATAAHRFDVLGDAPDEAFDRVAHLATRLLRVPAAFVSLVDADRKVIKAARGLGGSRMEVARSEALCAIPVRTGRPVSIRDVRADPRTASNPILVADPGLASYAGAPLITHDGLSIGALGVLDRVQRDFDEDELDDLAQLAVVIVRELELRLAARRVALRG